WQGDVRGLGPLRRAHERSAVLDDTGPRPQLPGEDSFGLILRHHGDEGVGTLLGHEAHVGEGALVGEDGHRRDPVRRFEERIDEPGHVEDLERARKDGEGLGMLRLCLLALDDPVAESAARALVGEQQADWARAHDQDIDVARGGRHGPSWKEVLAVRPGAGRYASWSW